MTARTPTRRVDSPGRIGPTDRPAAFSMFARSPEPPLTLMQAPPAIGPDTGSEVPDSHDAFDSADWTLAQIVEAHRGYVLRRALWLTRNPHDADDLTQEVFIRVFRALPNYVPGGSFRAWLYRITTNLYLDQLRRRKRIRFDPLPQGAVDRLPDPDSDPAEVVHDGLLEADIQQALASMSQTFRSAVVLRDIEGLSYAQIATLLGIKQGTVRTRIYRGRGQLRASLAHRAPHHTAAAAPRKEVKAA
jgi:RNA polymerase sigma factor (sigma-70 family)